MKKLHTAVVAITLVFTLTNAAFAEQTGTEHHGNQALLFPASLGAGEGEWSRFRGPNGSGISGANHGPDPLDRQGLQLEGQVARRRSFLPGGLGSADLRHLR